jgi:hypothetical protein
MASLFDRQVSVKKKKRFFCRKQKWVGVARQPSARQTACHPHPRCTIRGALFSFNGCMDFSLSYHGRVFCFAVLCPPFPSQFPRGPLEGCHAQVGVSLETCKLLSNFGIIRPNAPGAGRRFREVNPSSSLLDPVLVGCIWCGVPFHIVNFPKVASKGPSRICLLPTISSRGVSGQE